MPTWPASLPQRLEQDGYQHGFPSGTIRTEMDAGYAYQRQRFTAAVEPLAGTLWLDADQYATLYSFFRDDLGDGSLPFDWIHPVTLAAASMRFTGSPRISGNRGLLFMVQVDLEILP